MSIAAPTGIESFWQQVAHVIKEGLPTEAKTKCDENWEQALKEYHHSVEKFRTAKEIQDNARILDCRMLLRVLENHPKDVHIRTARFNPPATTEALQRAARNIHVERLHPDIQEFFQHHNGVLLVWGCKRRSHYNPGIDDERNDAWQSDIEKLIADYKITDKYNIEGFILIPPIEHIFLPGT